MRVNLDLAYQTRDEQGRTLSRWCGPAHCFVTGYIRFLISLMSAVTTGYTDTSGIGKSHAPGTAGYHGSLEAPATGSLYGIIVGSSAAAALLANTKIGTKIDHGVAPGNLSYGGTTKVTDIASAARQFVRYQRSFTNNTGASVTAREMALYAILVDPAASNYYCCFARDVFLADQVIPHLGSLTCTYELYTEP